MIETAIESVIVQDTAAFEHIVVDGASTDDTLQRLRRFPHLQIISEPDRGLYDAINKGILAAKGDVICLLNSDDQLMPGAISCAVSALSAHPEAAAACGRVRMSYLDNSTNDIEVGTPAMLRLREQDVISGLPLTNGRFIRRSAFDTVGLFDQDFPVLADRDLLGRFYLAGFLTAPIDAAVYRYVMHDMSLTFSGLQMPENYLREAIRLAGRRLAESVSLNERQFYRRWLSWAKGYAALRGIAERDFGAARDAICAEGGMNSFLPMSFIAEAIRHAAGVRERRGVPIAK